MTLHVTAGCDKRRLPGRCAVAHRERCGRLCGNQRQVRSSGRLPLLRTVQVPNVDIEAKAVFTNNPNSGAMRGFGSNQAQFAMEGVMDMLAQKAGLDGYDIRERNVLRPGDPFATGQIMREKRRHPENAASGEGNL